MEEVARFHLTSNFVVNADEDGEIIDYDENSKMMIAKYSKLIKIEIKGLS